MRGWLVYGLQTEFDALKDRLQRLVPVREGNSITLLGNGDIAKVT